MRRIRIHKMNSQRQRTTKKPMNTVLIKALVLFVGTKALPSFAEVSQPLRVSTDFPGGSAEILEVDAQQRKIHVQPALQWEHGWPCWWYFRMDGLVQGEKYEITVTANPRPYRRQEVLGHDWLQPDRAAISTDDKSWQQTSECRREQNGKAIYQFEATNPQMWLAWGPPFILSHAIEILTEADQKIENAERFVLAKTRNGRDVPAIRIGGGSKIHPAKYGVWIQARQHAWEAGSSWVGRGFFKWITSDDPAAVTLRNQATIYYVPIMDVDRVTAGEGGKNSVPRDHNRDWDDNPFYPAVAAAQQHLAELYQAHQLDVFIDLHNPGAGEKQPYFFGPYYFEKLPAISQRNYNQWLELAKQSINGPLKLESKYFITSYVKDDEELNRMSSNWVRNHTGPKMLAVTLETAWNTPHSTQTGYQIVGRQLGETLAKYLQQNPRRKLDVKPVSR